MEPTEARFRQKLRLAVAHTAFWPRAWRLVWSAAPRQTLISLVLLLLQGVLPVAGIYSIKLVVDSVVQAASTGSLQDNAIHTVTLAALAGGFMLSSEVIQGIIEWLRTAQSELVHDHIKNLVHARSTEVDLAFYEMAEYYDRLEQARNEASTRPLALLDSVGSLVQNGITMVAMAALLIPYGLLTPLVMLLSTLPALYVAFSFDRRYHRWWQASTVDRRWTHYYDSLLTQGPPAAEVRLFGLGHHFRGLYQRLRTRLRSERLGLLRKQAVARVLAGVIGLLISGVMVGWMIWRAVQGMATLGDLVLFYQAFQRGQGLMRALLGNLGQIYSNTLFLGNLFAFLDMQPELRDPIKAESTPAVLQHGIRFRDVTFSYPGSTRPALQHFNLTVPANKIVAIVGANGTGKSTLIKLMCRFYDPQSGSIELDGVDIRSFAIDDLRRRISVLFQFPIFYSATAHENIALGDLSASSTAADTMAAARSAGAHDFAARLPSGYDTLLGKLFGGGAELSGGEWQRLATARAYFRRSPILLLDEPTSFMDSWAEADWFQRFRALAEGRTGLIITHRFTIAMRADVIHVMDDGQVVESGTHRELLALGGLYAQSWTIQMQVATATGTPELADEPAA